MCSLTSRPLDSYSFWRGHMETINKPRVSIKVQMFTLFQQKVLRLTPCWDLCSPITQTLLCEVCMFCLCMCEFTGKWKHLSGQLGTLNQLELEDDRLCVTLLTFVQLKRPSYTLYICVCIYFYLFHWYLFIAIMACNVARCLQHSWIKGRHEHCLD